MGFIMRTALSDKDLEARRAVEALKGEEKKIELQKAVEALKGEEKPPEDPDRQKLQEQILKYVPLEVVGFYVPSLAALATLKTLYFGTTDPPLIYYFFPWIIFSIATGGTFYYIYKTSVEDLKKKKIPSPEQRAWVKAGISSVAFLIWAITLGGPWSFLVHFEAIGALLIPAFTFLSPIIYDSTIGLIAKPPTPPVPKPAAPPA
jgi:hypothetical protein